MYNITFEQVFNNIFYIMERRVTMNLLALQYFCKIAQYGNMTRAAEVLHVSQPALSKTLHHLETELGQPLFHRSSTGLILTDAGAAFYERISESLALIDEAVTDIHKANHVAAPVLRISSCIHAAFLPKLYLSFQQQHPNVRLRLQLMEGKPLSTPDSFDFCILAANYLKGPYYYLDLFEESFVLAVPPTHPLAKEQSIDLAQAAPYEFITLGSAAPLSRFFHSLCQIAQFTPNVAVECDSISTLYSFLYSGKGIALIPQHTANIDWTRLCPVHIRTPHCSRTIQLCWPRDKTLCGIALTFEQFCYEYFKPFRQNDSPFPQPK